MTHAEIRALERGLEPGGAESSVTGDASSYLMHGWRWSGRAALQHLRDLLLPQHSHSRSFLTIGDEGLE